MEGTALNFGRTICNVYDTVTALCVVGCGKGTAVDDNRTSFDVQGMRSECAIFVGYRTTVDGDRSSFYRDTTTTADDNAVVDG